MRGIKEVKEAILVGHVDQRVLINYFCKMFYRRKIILALLQIFDGELEKIRIQKLLFLLTKKQTKPDYHFIPYKFGCYSYSANADLTAMSNKGALIETDSHFKRNDSLDFVNSLREPDKKILSEVKRLYGSMNSHALMKHTYVNYPYFAINSIKATSILAADELKKVDDCRPHSTATTLFTIGYEGISVEEYLNKLLKNDIKLLADVRCNPLSMKYGFSKGQLQKFCENIGIEYMHFPELGIESEQRQNLGAQKDYDALFLTYKENLPNLQLSQQRIVELLQKYKRIALTCFESNIHQCHRKHLAEAIQSLPVFEYNLRHI